VEERDLRVLLNERALEKVVQLLCKVRPKLVITHSPDDYHLDHEMTSRIVRGATFAAPIPNFLYGHLDHPPLDHIPYLFYCDPLEGKDVYGNPIRPKFLIDITDVLEVKAEALAKHASQRDWLLKHHGVDEFVIAMRNWAADQGKRCGVAAAEGFRQHLGHSYPQDNLLGTLLNGLQPS
jgi:LmbE family N-acetylglucosaminyl deacetylase